MGDLVVLVVVLVIRLIVVVIPWMGVRGGGRRCRSGRRRSGGGSGWGDGDDHRVSSLDGDRVAVLVVEQVNDVVGLGVLPLGVGAAHRDGDGVPVGQVPHLNGPIHQLLGHGGLVFVVVRVPFDQIPAILVQALQVQHPLGAAEGHLHIRVDLNAQGAVGGEVGTVVSKEHQAQAGGQRGQSHQGLPGLAVGLG